MVEKYLVSEAEHRKTKLGFPSATMDDMREICLEAMENEKPNYPLVQLYDSYLDKRVKIRFF